MTPSILITNNLVRDLVGADVPADERPRLHIGPDEAHRLDGGGLLARFVAAAHEAASDEFSVIHCRDWHRLDDPEFARFGPHCVAGSPGTRFVFEDAFPPAWRTSRHVHVIHSRLLAMFPEGILPGLIRYVTHLGDPAAARYGVIGVTTGIKIAQICEGLQAYFGAREIAIAQDLVASTTLQDHFDALDRMERTLGVRVFDRAQELLAWLTDAGKAAAVGVAAPGAGAGSLVRERYGAPRHLDAALEGEDRELLMDLVAGSTTVKTVPIGGGFSGARVLFVHRSGSRGEQLAPAVAKMADRQAITQERRGHALAKALIGPVAPEVIAVAYGPSRGGLLFALAGLRRPPLRTLKDLILAPLPGEPSAGERAATATASVEDRAAVQGDVMAILADLGQRPLPDRVNLYAFNNFKASYRDHTARRVPTVVADVGGAPQGADAWVLPGGVLVRSPVPFYDEILARRIAGPSVPILRATAHGDLNFANVLVDEAQNIWLIDFFHTRADHHAVQDAAKLENDLKMILTRIAGPDDLAAARDLEDALVTVPERLDDLPEPPPSVRARPRFALAYALVRVIRRFAASASPDARPGPYFVPLLRYALHSLSFEECGPWEKAHALVSADLLGRRLARDGP